MQPTSPMLRQSAGPDGRGRYVVLCLVLTLVGLIGLVVYGVTGFFRLSRDTGVLRDCLLSSVPGQAEKKIALRVGPLTTGFIRAGSRFFPVPPEARAALEAFQGGEVGLYRLTAPASAAQWASAIGRADKAMERRGWMRTVGVARERELVAVYIRDKGVAAGRVQCCVFVVRDSEVVLVSARANLNPVMDLARKHLDLHEQFAAARIR